MFNVIERAIGSNHGIATKSFLPCEKRGPHCYSMTLSRNGVYEWHH